MLHLTRDLIALRRARRRPARRRVRDAARARRRVGVAARRAHAVALNLSDAEVTVEGLRGRVAIATDRARDGEAVDGALTLGAWQGAVVETA